MLCAWYSFEILKKVLFMKIMCIWAGGCLERAEGYFKRSHRQKLYLSLLFFLLSFLLSSILHVSLCCTFYSLVSFFDHRISRFSILVD